jgi:nucleoside-diphosphate-sugar epimerase
MTMKILFIGGTGLISSACSELALERGFELFILNRGQSHKYPLPAGAQWISADVRNVTEVTPLLRQHHFDSVVDWIAFTPADIERDMALFAGKTRQFVFISSASAYQKPPSQYLITESTPLANPYWEYSRNKIACEERLMHAFRQEGFPVTIVRPSHTYGPSQIPLCVDSWLHPYTVIERMKRGQKIIVPGDGTSLWTLTWNGDFAKGFVGLLGRETTLGHPFHITSDEVLTWDQIYREAGHAAGVEPDIIHIPSELIAAHDPEAIGSLIGDKANCAVFDNSKIKRYVPDFVATVPWSEGVRRSLAWHEAHPEYCTIDQAANQRWDATIAAYQRAFTDA